LTDVASPVAELAAKYEATAASFVKEHRLPGAAVGVVHGGELAWAGGVGFADRASRRRSDPRTLYRIASITKTVTATAVMQLRDEGKLVLDDPAIAYLPELESAQSPLGPIEGLTIRRMLSHESGLQSEPPGTNFTEVEYEDDPGRTLARAAEIELRVPVNSQRKYSNLAYQLLGEIVSRVAGTPYPKYIRSRILRPVGMTSTSLDPLPQRLGSRRATGYEPRFLSDELELAPSETSVFGAEGGLWSCVEDLGRWLSCQLSDEPGIISKKTLDEMHKPRYLADEEWTSAWCIGWYARRREDVVWIMHSGGYYGFITNACFEPKEKVGAIALVNGIGNATELALELGTLARDAVREAAPELEAPKAIPEEWRPFLGLYLAAHFGTVMRVEWLDGKLTVLDPDDPTWKPTLAPTDDPDVFKIEPGFRESGELARFERGRDGGILALFLAVARLQRLEPVPAD
jgi:CubicO group peptidase (beta-lactamase class C family)